MTADFDAWLNEHGLDGMEMLTVREATRSGVAERTIRRYIADGVLATTLVQGARAKEHRIKPKDLYNVISARSGAIERAKASPVEDMAAEIAALRQVIEELRHEQRDARHQIHQLHEQLVRALPAPRRSWWPWSRKKD